MDSCYVLKILVVNDSVKIFIQNSSQPWGGYFFHSHLFPLEHAYKYNWVVVKMVLIAFISLNE